MSINVQATGGSMLMQTKRNSNSMLDQIFFGHVHNSTLSHRRAARAANLVEQQCHGK